MPAPSSDPSTPRTPTSAPAASRSPASRCTACGVAGLLASQQVVFGGRGETLTIRHDTISDESYEQGIMLALRAVREATGVTVGLDALLGLGSIGGEVPPAPVDPRDTSDLVQD